MFYGQIMQFLIITGGSSAPAATEAAIQGTKQAGGFFGSAGTAGILIYAVVIGGLYFFMIRPQKKREKEVKLMQAALAVGDNVLTTSGMYGIITSVYAECFVVEFGTNKGVRIPMRKIDIIGKREPNLTNTPTEEPLPVKQGKFLQKSKNEPTSEIPEIIDTVEKK